MPMYEYRCSKCGFQEEHLQKASEPPLTVCPSCGKAKFEKLLSAAGFQLKGSGWYATDFKSSGKPAAAKDVAKSESTAQSKSEAKAEPKSETKSSETKTESKSEPASTGKSPASTTN